MRNILRCRFLFPVFVYTDTSMTVNLSCWNSTGSESCGIYPENNSFRYSLTFVNSGAREYRFKVFPTAFSQLFHLIHDCAILFTGAQCTQYRLQSASGRIGMPYRNQISYSCQVSITIDWFHPLSAITAFDFTVSRETLRCDSISVCSLHNNPNYNQLPDAFYFLTEIISATVAKYRNELIRSPRSKNSLRLFCFTWNITVRFDFHVLVDTTIPTTIATGRIELPYGNQISNRCQVSQRIDPIPSSNNSLRLFCFTWNITVRFNLLVLNGMTIP